jgi:2-isopropylmalate synthase
MSTNSPEPVLIFDTTLRDGEQSPGCSMNLTEKLEMARGLRDLGVDIIEAGFPIASPGDFEAVRAIAREITGPIICGLARCNNADIDRAAEALKDAPRRRIHVFLATSAIHREFKLKMTREEIIKRAVDSVQRACQFTDDVEFSPEDAARTELDFLTEVCIAAAEAGAKTLNIPDTVGYAVPSHYAAIIRHLKANIPQSDKLIFSVHCHNDLGLAVANSLAAVQEGARQIECTINGIGERAGNTALEEIVMALRTRYDFYQLPTRINTKMLYPLSRKLSSITGMQVQRNKAIVGQNAFAHEAGIHQDGMLKNRSTYEIMRPEDVGIPSTELVLGKHSGRNALKHRVEELGYKLDDQQFQQLFESFKALADRKKNVYDADIEALIDNQFHSGGEIWTLLNFTCSASFGVPPTAAVTLKHRDGHTVCEPAIGDGPVDAVLKSIQKGTGVELKVTDYRVRSVTGGLDAQAEATLEVEYENKKLNGRGLNTNVIEASALAFLQVINRIAQRQIRPRLKPTDHVPTEVVPTI